MFLLKRKSGRDLAMSKTIVTLRMFEKKKSTINIYILHLQLHQIFHSIT